MLRQWILLAACLLAVSPDSPDEKPVPLFDGKSLEGWKTVNTKDNFVVKDGVLVMNKGTGWLATEKTYRDFELRVRYRFVTPGADSGIFIRSGLEGKPWTNKGYQIQNMDNQTLGEIISMGAGPLRAEHKTELARKTKKDAGTWMDLTIMAKGKHCEVTLDGEKIATSDDLKLEEGRIGLQAEGGVLEFERIELKSLSN